MRREAGKRKGPTPRFTTQPQHDRCLIRSAPAEGGRASFKSCPPPPRLPAAKMAATPGSQATPVALPFGLPYWSLLHLPGMHNCLRGQSESREDSHRQDQDKHPFVALFVSTLAQKTDASAEGCVTQPRLRLCPPTFLKL